LEIAKENRKKMILCFFLHIFMFYFADWFVFTIFAAK